MPDEPAIVSLRAELLELAASVRRLQQAGRDSATSELLLRRRRADFEDATKENHAEGPSEILL
ncbi:MAG: hypothetical protein ACRC1G_21870 [Bradyrhizobium sp.]